MNIGVYKIEERALFFEHFYNLEEQIDYSLNWTELSGLFTMRGLYSMQCYQAGELQYNGIPIDTAIKNSLPSPDNSNNNTAIWIEFSSSGYTQIEIKGRKDGDNCISVLCDLGAQTVSIRKWISGTPEILAERSYVWDDEYSSSIKLMLCMYDNRIFVIINGTEVICALSENFLTNFGFSISVPLLDDSYATQFFSAGVSEIYHYPDSTPLDKTDLLVMFRDLLKAKLDVSPRNYRSYVTDKKSWELYKDLGLSDEQWSYMGREVNKPVTEYYLKESWTGNCSPPTGYGVCITMFAYPFL